MIFFHASTFPLWKSSFVTGMEYMGVIFFGAPEGAAGAAGAASAAAAAAAATPAERRGVYRERRRGGRGADATSSAADAVLRGLPRAGFLPRAGAGRAGRDHGAAS